MSTYTYSQTFTRTHARYLASKISADLKQMQRFYGKPSDELIDDYNQEIVELLIGGYLDSVVYGYKRNGDWVVALSYTVQNGQLTSNDDRSGKVFPSANVEGCQWGSYLWKSSTFSLLSAEQKKGITDSLPIDRTPANEPGTVDGEWIIDKSYSKNGTSINRKTFRPR